MKQDFKDGAQYMETQEHYIKEKRTSLKTTQEHYIKEKRTSLKTKDNIIEFWSDKKI